MQGLGSNLIIVIPGGTSNGKFQSPAQAQGIVITSLVQQDVDALSRDPSVAAVTEEARGQANASSATTMRRSLSTACRRISLPYAISPWQNGYPFTDNDVQAYNHVAVIGSDARDDALRRRSDPVGQYIQVKNIQFRVVGVLAAKGHRRVRHRSG